MRIIGRNLLTVVVACMPLLLVPGCGGGGETSPPFRNFVMSAPAPSQPWIVPSTTLSATDNSGNTYSVTYSATPGGMAMFNGQSAKTILITLSISKNGAVFATEDSKAYYLTDPYSPLGLSGTTNGLAWTAIITSYTPLQGTLTVGQSGSLSSATYYDATNKVLGSWTETYSVGDYNAGAVVLNIDGAGTVNGVLETPLLGFPVQSDGTISGLTQAQITVNGTTLVFL